MEKLYFASYKVSVLDGEGEVGTAEGMVVGADYAEVVTRIAGYYGDEYIVSIDHIEFLNDDSCGVFDFNDDYKLTNLSE